MAENAVATKTPQEIVRMQLNKMEPEFKHALPAHVPVEKFVRVTMTAVQTNPSLLDADRRTLFAAATRAAQMGLLPDGREGAIVTFKGQCQFMSMTAGLLKLCRNSGEISSIDVQIVHANDKFTYRPGIDLVPVMECDWFGERGDMVGVFAVAKMKDGAAYVEIMSKKQVDKVRSVSRSKDGGPWSQWYDEMARKTVIRRLAKRLPMSTDLDGLAIPDEDEVAAPQQVQEYQEEVKPKSDGVKRPRGLQAVVDAQPDADGVIDVSSTELEPMPEEQYESPI
jgi:recombination protein RecT